MSRYKGDRHYCTVEGCRNQKKNENLSFFNLPKDAVRRHEWLKIIGRTDLIHNKVKHSSYQVCSKHFEDSMMYAIQIRKLRPNAKPCKLVNIPQPNTAENGNGDPNKSDSENDTDTQNQSTQTNESYVNELTEIKKENDTDAAAGDTQKEAKTQKNANTQTNEETQIATGSPSSKTTKRQHTLITKQPGYNNKKIMLEKN